MTLTASLPAAAAIHEIYQREFGDRIRACGGESVLDIGCGRGERLAALSTGGWCRCVGLEPDDEAAEEARGKGLDVVHGQAEALPFQDGTFDVVLLEYTAHHLADLTKSLGEAARVARRAVHILDCWHDQSIISQQVAREVDHWIKSVDRRLGMVHNPCPEPVELADPFRRIGGFALDWSCRLVLRPFPIAKLQQMLEEKARSVNDAAELEEVRRIVFRAQSEGMTDDGALLFSAVRV